MPVIYFIRHGEARYDLAEERGLKGGMRDFVPLTDRGRIQAQLAAELLRGLPIGRILTSPMTRAMETAHIIAGALGLPVTVEFDLHEWLPDLSHSYDSTRYALEQSADMDAHGGEWPSGESRPWEPLSRVRERVRKALVQYLNDSPIAVVGHGVVIRAVTGANAGNGEIVRFEWDSR